MDSFGRYTFQYQPSSDDTEYLQVGVQMSISAEASLGDMLNFFDSFLKASGYVYDGEIQIVKDETETPKFDKPWTTTESNQDFWNEDGISLTGNPGVLGGGLLGGLSEDYICFKTSSDNNIVTF